MSIPRLLLAFLLLAGIGVFAWWTERPAVRYAMVGNSQDCAVSQMLNMPQQADFLAFGSSRVRRGLDAGALAEMSGGELANGYNLGRPGRSVLRSYVQLRDLIEAGVRPKVVFVEVYPENFDLRGHEKLIDYRGAGYATFPDLGEVFVALESNPSLAANTVAQLVMKKFSLNLVSILTGEVRHAFNVDNKPADSVCWSQGFDRETEKREKKKRQHLRKLERLHGGTIPEIDETFEFGVSPRTLTDLHVVSLMRNLGREYGFKLVLGRQGGLKEPLLDAATVAAIKSYLPEYADVPADIAKSLDEHFMDPHHLGPEGRAIYTRWLAGVIRSRQEL